MAIYLKQITATTVFPAAHSAIIKAGDLVQMLTWEDRPDDISTETGGSRGRRGGGTASGGRVANSR